jgi:hypothetical protein
MRLRCALLAMALAAVSACGGGPTSAARPGAGAAVTGAPPTAAPGPATPFPPPTAAPTAAAQLDRCHTVGLALTAVGSSGGAAGSFVQTFGMVNRGSTACTFYGYPGMAMLDASGAQLPTHVVRDTGSRFPFVKLGTYTVQPGQTAPFWVHWTSMPVGSETCSTSAGIIVTPPDETTQLRLDGVHIQACNMGQLDVSPVAAPGTKAP